MKLINYITDIRQISFSEAAREMSALAGRRVLKQSVLAWAHDKADPRGDEKVMIFEWSNGHVTPNDFYELPAHVPLRGNENDAPNRRSFVDLTGEGGDKALAGQIDMFMGAHA